MALKLEVRNSKRIHRGARKAVGPNSRSRSPSPNRKSDSERKEFLADASSFANADGGHLIYGMKEQSGVAIELCGLDVDGDAVISALESRIRDGISPREAV
jgi:predicted HTH transcriptional regulator